MYSGSLSSNFLVGRFAEFYEEVVRIKLAIGDGRLPVYLVQEGGKPASVNAVQLASMVSGRLYNMLAQQGKSVRAGATETEIRAYAKAQFVMAALADEIFILELDWPGRQAWLDYLIEKELFRTSTAGRMFFEYAEQLLKTPEQSPLHVDLATVFLIALQLGFKGQHRGSRGELILKQWRKKLWQYISARRRENTDQLAFAQAYQHLAAETEGKRIATLSRWYMAGAAALAVYLIVSTSIWFGLLYPFNNKYKLEVKKESPVKQVVKS